MKHQQTATELAKRVDMMLVVGSRTSANTRRLAEICADIVDTHHIERAQEIEQSWLDNESIKRVGVTAGASTPDETIDEVIAMLEG